MKVIKDIKTVYCDSYIKYPYLEIYINTDWLSDKETQKSTLPYVTMLASCSLFWFLKKQTIVTQFSIKAKYIATFKATKEAF